jgi:hypothetical protein
MALERLYIPLEYKLKDKISQNYALEKFLKEVKRLFKPKDKYLMALEQLFIPLEYFLRIKNTKITL